MKVACPRCQTHCDAVPGQRMTCPTCRFSDIVPPDLYQAAPEAGRPTYAGGPATYTAPPTGGAAWHEAPTIVMQQQQARRTPVSMGLAVAALLLNVLLLPGLGSLIAGRTNEGIWQLVLFVGWILMAILLVLTIIGIFLVPFLALAPVAAWIWGLVTGIQLISEAQ